MVAHCQFALAPRLIVQLGQHGARLRHLRSQVAIHATQARERPLRHQHHPLTPRTNGDHRAATSDPTWKTPPDFAASVDRLVRGVTRRFESPTNVPRTTVGRTMLSSDLNLSNDLAHRKSVSAFDTVAVPDREGFRLRPTIHVSSVSVSWKRATDHLARVQLTPERRGVFCSGDREGDYDASASERRTMPRNLASALDVTNCNP